MGDNHATGHLLRAVDRRLSMLNGQCNRRSSFDGLGLVCSGLGASIFRRLLPKTNTLSRIDWTNLLPGPLKGTVYPVNQSLRNILKQVTPPVVVSLGKALLHRRKKSSRIAHQQAIAALKTAYEQRNAKAAEDEIVFRDGLTLRIHPESKEAFEHFCYISPTMVREMDCFIEQTRDKKRLLDIGALHGVFSLVFATGFPSRTAVAVDASPIAFSKLLYNIHKNNLTNVTPIECALSDISGTLRMHYEWEHAVAAETSEPDQKYLSVTKRTVDELCEDLSFDPDVLKIDVEGHEVKIVKGLSRLLGRRRPLIFLELHPSRIIQERDQIEDLTKIFDAGGYRASLVDGSAIQLQDIPHFTEDQRMFLTPV